MKFNAFTFWKNSAQKYFIFFIPFIWTFKTSGTWSLVKATDPIIEHWTGKELAFTDTSNMWLMLRSGK